MPKDAGFKREVHAFMDRTGEKSYARARQKVLAMRAARELFTVVAPCDVTIDRGCSRSRVILEVVASGLRVAFDGEDLGLVPAAVRHGKAHVPDGEYPLVDGWGARFETESEEPVPELGIHQSGGSLALLAPGFGGGRRPAEVSVYLNSHGGVAGTGGSVLAPSATLEEMLENAPPAFRPAIVALSGYLARYAGAAVAFSKLHSQPGAATAERVKRRADEVAHWRGRIVAVLERRFADVADWAIRYIDRSLGLPVEGEPLDVVLQRVPTEDGFAWTVVNQEEYRVRCAMLQLYPTPRFTMSHDIRSDMGREAAEEAVVWAFTHRHPGLAGRISTAPYPVPRSDRPSIFRTNDPGSRLDDPMSVLGPRRPG